MAKRPPKTTAPTPPTPEEKAPTTPQSIEARIKEKLEALEGAKEQIQLQLNAVENQIYILNTILNPPPAPKPTQAPPPTPEWESQSDAPPKPLDHGTI